MKCPIVLKNKQFCFDSEQVVTVAYPFEDREDNWSKFILEFCLNTGNAQGKQQLVYDNLTEAVEDYQQLVDELFKVFDFKRELADGY